MTTVPLAAPALANVRQKQYQKAIFTKLTLKLVLIAAIVQIYVRLKQSARHKRFSHSLQKDEPALSVRAFLWDKNMVV